MKSCCHCGEEILTKNGGERYCRNGCDICTALPAGDKYYDTPGAVTEGDVITTFGGINNLRRLPTCEE